MRFLLTYLLLILSLYSSAQDDQFELLLKKPSGQVDCKSISNKVNIDINTAYENDSINELINSWEDVCGINEPLLRLKIIFQILNKIKSDSLITNYFSNYSNILFDRIADSNEPNYSEIYFYNQRYYSYIPLKGEFDNLISILSKDILLRGDLDKNEQLICLLFSFNTEQYDKLIKKKEYRESDVGRLEKEQRNYSDDPIKYRVSVGGWMPLNDPNNTFGLNPQLGIGFGIQVNKVQFDLGLKLRINLNDNDFFIKSEGDTIETSSDIGALLGVNAEYFLYQKNNWSLGTEIGVGWDIINTDVQKMDTRSEEDDYEDINTINLSCGLIITRKIFYDDKIGVELNYHFVPYYIDDNYFTQFSSDYLTFDIIYRF